MAATDRFKRTLDAGTSFFGMTRERAETVVREWVDSGDLRKARAQKAIDDLMARSRKMTDELREMIRREIKEQVNTLGFATQHDLARLEAKIDSASPGRATKAVAQKAGAKSPPRKAIAKRAPARPAAAKKAPAKKAPAKKAPAKKAARATEGAPITKAATVQQASSVKKAPAAKPGRPRAAAAGEAGDT